jgi:hypothetical protein
MADDNDKSDSSGLESLRRYMPLAIWAVVILVALAIPFKIIGYGYLPVDDALRHAAKAVSGKSWSQILVLNDVYKIDHEFGWNLLLEKIHLWTNCDAEKLVLFSVVGLFLLVSWSAMACLKRPEAWLAMLALVSMASGLLSRLCLGRPFLLSMAVLMVILLMWQRHGQSPPKWRAVLWMTSLITLAVFFHGVWYLWALPVAAFFIAQQFRWCFMLALSWMLATVLGAALTGHPVEYICEALQVALRAMGMHETQSTLVTELRPSGGDVFMVLLLGGMIVLRQLAKFEATPLHRNPAMWLAVLGWVMGCETDRFWDDWGAPALMVLLTCDLQSFFEMRFAPDSLKRFGLVCGLALTAYVVTTNDVNSRWSSTLKTQYLSVAEHPELEGWMPDKGGIFYSADMTLFYQTFYKNPDGDWRYILGFESTFMPLEDFNVYHSVMWNNGDGKAYAPWVRKMRPLDRLVVRGVGTGQPDIPGLDWYYGVSGVWLGRVPQTNSSPALKISAASAVTNSPASTK